MQILSPSFPLLHPPHADLLTPLVNIFEGVLQNGDILSISSKVVSIHEGRCIEKSTIRDKDTLIMAQAERFYPRNRSPHGYVINTIRHHTLIGSAGIDESNGNGFYVLWPEDPQKSADSIRQTLCQHFNLHDLGVLITDSHSMPFRYGVTGICIGYSGISPLQDYRGSTDLFGRVIQSSQLDLVDSLSAMANLYHGEGAEAKPVVLLRDLGLSSLQFTAHTTASDLFVPFDQDIHRPLFEAMEPGGQQSDG